MQVEANTLYKTDVEVVKILNDAESFEEKAKSVVKVDSVELVFALY